MGQPMPGNAGVPVSEYIGSSSAPVPINRIIKNHRIILRNTMMTQNILCLFDAHKGGSQIFSDIVESKIRPYHSNRTGNQTAIKIFVGSDIDDHQTFILQVRF